MKVLPVAILSALVLASCGTKTEAPALTKSGLDPKNFVSEYRGDSTALYTLSNANGMEFDVISAVILGGASLSGGKGSIVGALFGALLLGTLSNGMVMLNIHTYWQQVISGVVLVLAVVLDVIKNRSAQRTLAA